MRQGNTLEVSLADKVLSIKTGVHLYISVQRRLGVNNALGLSGSTGGVVVADVAVEVCGTLGERNVAVSSGFFQLVELDEVNALDFVEVHQAVHNLIDVKYLLHFLGHFGSIHKQALALFGKIVVKAHYDYLVNTALVKMIYKIRQERIERYDDVRIFIACICKKIVL